MRRKSHNTSTLQPGQVNKTISYAVVLKTYTWDSFVHRQADRLLEVTGYGDFFISADETNETLDQIPFPHVIRTSNAKLVAMGLANRFERGSLIWWNADYPHYEFYAQHSDYDYYIFVEYDVVVQMQISDLINYIESAKTDFVAQSTRVPTASWFWTRYHRHLYPISELRGSLNCLAVFSNRSMQLLYRRRLEMAMDKKVRYWPISEVFIATEIARAGFSYVPLDTFGNVSSYDWYPPLLEDDLPVLREKTFLHPVLDSKRYVSLNLRSNASPVSFLRKDSMVRLSLARIPEAEYKHLLQEAFVKRLRVVLVEQLERVWLRMCRTLLRR